MCHAALQPRNARAAPMCSDSGRPQCLWRRQGPGHPPPTPGGPGGGSLPVPSYDSALARRTLCTVRICLGIEGLGGTLWLNASVSPWPKSALPSCQPEQKGSVGVSPGASGLGLGLAFGLLRAYLFISFSVVCIPNPDQSHQSLRCYSISWHLEKGSGIHPGQRSPAVGSSTGPPYRSSSPRMDCLRRPGRPSSAATPPGLGAAPAVLPMTTRGQALGLDCEGDHRMPAASRGGLGPPPLPSPGPLRQPLPTAGMAAVSLVMSPTPPAIARPGRGSTLAGRGSAPTTHGRCLLTPAARSYQALLPPSLCSGAQATWPDSDQHRCSVWLKAHLFQSPMRAYKVGHGKKDTEAQTG